MNCNQAVVVKKKHVICILITLASLTSNVITLSHNMISCSEKSADLLGARPSQHM